MGSLACVVLVKMTIRKQQMITARYSMAVTYTDGETGRQAVAGAAATIDDDATGNVFRRRGRA